MSLRITSEKLTKKLEVKRNVSGSKALSSRNWGEGIQTALRMFPDGTYEELEYDVNDLMDSKAFAEMVYKEVEAITGDPKEIVIFEDAAYRPTDDETKAFIRNLDEADMKEFVEVDFENNIDIFEEVPEVTGTLSSLFDEACNVKNMSHTRYYTNGTDWYRVQIRASKDGEISKTNFMQIA